MKKFLFLAAITASMGILTSCSQDDEFSSPSGVTSNTIAFATRSSQTMTRSGETINALTKFTVSAVNNDNTSFFSNEEFNFDVSAGVFKSQLAHYWPTAGALSFYAISDPGTHTVDANNVPVFSYSNWAGEKDLVAATAIAGEKEMPYPLTFKHLTSQIYVSAEAENKTEELTYKLVSVHLTAPSTGTYTFAETTGGVGNWQIDNTQTSDYSYDEALPIAFKQNGMIELSSYYWNVLPTTDGQLNFRIEYQVLQNGKVISDFTGNNHKTCTINAPELLAGKMYRYNFLLTRDTQDEVTFGVSVSGWEDGTSTNGTPTGATADNNAQNVNANGYEYVDLGLPSGNLWATCNIGQTDPTVSCAIKFKWGEVVASTKYDKSEYKFWDGEAYTKYTTPGARLELEDDAAHVNMGGDWHMPSHADMVELVQNTTVTKDGYKRTLTSKTDPTKQIIIYMPYDDNSGYNYGFWVSDLDSYDASFASYLCANSYGLSTGNGKARHFPMPVRGVITPNAE